VLVLASTTSAATGTSTAHAQAANSASAVKPTIVLVHGAFADSTSWSSEIAFLEAKGYHAIPPQAEFFMAKRAGAHIVATNSGHDVPAAQPGAVDSVILQAVRSAS
jgi:hypothetical protein